MPISNTEESKDEVDMGRCNKTHKDLNERLSCVQCMSSLQLQSHIPPSDDFEILLKDALDELSRKVAIKVVSNYMNTLNYNEKVIDYLAKECVEKNPYGKSVYNYVRESFGILYELGYRIAKKNEGG